MSSARDSSSPAPPPRPASPPPRTPSPRTEQMRVYLAAMPKVPPPAPKKQKTRLPLFNF